MAQTRPSWKLSTFWAKIREDLANFSVIYGCLASRKVNLEFDGNKKSVRGDAFVIEEENGCGNLHAKGVPQPVKKTLFTLGDNLPVEGAA
jgi:hypothetical protein